MMKRYRKAVHRGPGLHILAIFLAACVVPGLEAGQRAAEPGNVHPIAAVLARAETAYDSGDVAAAEREYAAVLAQDPRQPRALFRLAHLRQHVPHASVTLLQQYVRVVPSDAWGHLALAHAFAREGRGRLALDAYAKALLQEPKDRDIRLGHPRLLERLGRTDGAIRAFQEWLTENPEDDEVWRELARVLQRAGRLREATRALERARQLTPTDPALGRRIETIRVRTAPAIQLGMVGAGETGVTTRGTSMSADMAAGDSTRVGIIYHRRRISSFEDAAQSQRIGFVASGRPTANLQLNVNGGAAWTRADSTETSAFRPEAAFRIRRIQRGNGATFDVRLQRDSIEASPELVRDPVSRIHAFSAIDVPVHNRWRLLGQARVARLTRHDEENRRTGFATGMAFVVAPTLRLTGQWQQMCNGNPAVRGYFAPALVQIADAGLEFEREFDRGSVAIDAGAGVQRLRRDRQARLGSWAPSLRLWGSAAWNLGLRHQLLFEVELYDSHIADAVITSERWRYASLTASIRFRLP
jgi:tetratricopeptide (TPR) repeat protein